MSANDTLGNFVDETTSQRTLAPIAVASQVALMSGVSVSAFAGILNAVCAAERRSLAVTVCDNHPLQRPAASKQGMYSVRLSFRPLHPFSSCSGE